MKEKKPRRVFQLLKFLGNRMVITGILILIQVGWIAILFSQLASYLPWLNAVFTLLSVVMALYLINKDENPSYKLAWILLICVMPVFGGLMYLTMGNKRPARFLRQRIGGIQKRTRPLLCQRPELMRRMEEQDRRAAGTSRYIAGQGPFPLWGNTKATYYPVGDDMFRDMMPALEGAQQFIFLEFFIVAHGRMWDSILEVLKRKAAQGVDVRMIYDDVGCLNLIPATYYRQLEQMGIRCMAFNPFVPLVSVSMNNRDHRKILVVDGHTAFNGGVNLADEYINEKLRFGHWKDTGIKLQGDAVRNFTVMFLEMWNAFRKTDEDFSRFLPPQPLLAPEEAPGLAQPYGDSPLDQETLSANVYLELLSRARDYVYIFTPYLVIDDAMQQALCMAAKRGVDVRMATPGIPDKKTIYRMTRSYYPSLLKAGVRIYEYTPGFLHAKSFVCDDETAVVGTINLDYRSLYLHFECGTLLWRMPAVLDVKRDCLETFAKSREIALADTRRSLPGRLVNAVLRVFAPLM